MKLARITKRNIVGRFLWPTVAADRAEILIMFLDDVDPSDTASFRPLCTEGHHINHI